MGRWGIETIDPAFVSELPRDTSPPSPPALQGEPGVDDVTGTRLSPTGHRLRRTGGPRHLVRANAASSSPHDRFAGSPGRCVLTATPVNQPRRPTGCSGRQRAAYSSHHQEQRIDLPVGHTSMDTSLEPALARLRRGRVLRSSSTQHPSRERRVKAQESRCCPVSSQARGGKGDRTRTTEPRRDNPLPPNAASTQRQHSGGHGSSQQP